MNLFELKIVLRQIRHDLKCPNCKELYSERKIEVVGTTDSSGLFIANCKECTESIIVDVYVERRHRRISTRRTNYWKLGESISANEVLDMHNFLKRFDGDLRELIKANE